jgi:hypothetical protein
VCGRVPGVGMKRTKAIDMVCSYASSSTVDNACSSSRRVRFGIPVSFCCCVELEACRIWVVMGLDLGLKIRGMAPWDGKSTDTQRGQGLGGATAHHDSMTEPLTNVRYVPVSTR